MSETKVQSVERVIDPGNRSRSRAKPVALLVGALVALVAATLTFSSPGAAQVRTNSQSHDNLTEFEITGFRCDVKVTDERTRRNGTTVIKTTETGFTEASIALMSGTLTVESKAVVGADGSGRISGRWVLEPAASTGSIKGSFNGTIHNKTESRIESIGRGRQALRGISVRMVTTTPGPTPDKACGENDASLSFTGSGEASAQPDRTPKGVVVVESTKDFATTVADLTEVISANPNLTLIKTVDHQAAAASRDLVLAPTTELFFGNPNIGTPLMQASQSAGIDLPQKMLVWEDLLGTVKVAYNTPSYLQSRHRIKGADPQLETVANALAGLAGAATGTTVDPVFDAGRVRKNKGIVQVQSSKSVDEAYSAIVAALEAAPPVNVAFTLEHDANAARVGLELRPTKLVVFGNPSLGTTLMQTDQSIALDLPQKILVYENEHGETIIEYNDPQFIASRHRVRGQDDVLVLLNGALANFAGIGT